MITKIHLWIWISFEVDLIIKKRRRRQRRCGCRATASLKASGRGCAGDRGSVGAAGRYSLNMDLDSPQLLSKQGADGSISTPDSSALNKVAFYPFFYRCSHSAPLVL
jgi:hypothetical protein